MENLTPLTCPNCGGKLSPSQTGNTLVCQHCGIEHLTTDLVKVDDTRPQLDTAICIRLTDGTSIPLIAQGTRLPAEFTQSFSTSKDNQTTLDFTLVLCKDGSSQDGTTIGTFSFNHITPEPRGVPTLEVLLIVNEQQQLTVTAKEGSTNRAEVLGQVDLLSLQHPD